MRILISYKESYRVYSDALERTMRGLLPDADVAVCRLAEIGEQLDWRASTPTSWCRVARTPRIREGGRRGTGSLPSPTNRPRPASAGGGRTGSTHLLRSSCRSSTK